MKRRPLLNYRRRKSREIKFYENIVKESPNFYQALVCLGDAYTRAGFWEEGLVVDKKLCHLRPYDPVVFYNLACSYSLLGRIEAALAAFRKAVKLGYRDFNYAYADADLENLRRDRRFQRFVRSIVKKNGKER